MKIDRKALIFILVAAVVIALAVPVLFKLYVKGSTPVSAPSKETVSTSGGKGPAVNLVIPVNPLPTDDEIRESIRIRNERQSIADQAIAEVKSKADAVSSKIRMNQNELPTSDAPEEKQEIPAPETGPDTSKTPEILT